MTAKAFDTWSLRNFALDKRVDSIRRVLVQKKRLLRHLCLRRWLALILTMALPHTRRSHTGQRAGVGVLQATEGPEEVAPLQTNESLRDLVSTGRIQGTYPEF